MNTIGPPNIPDIIVKRTLDRDLKQTVEQKSSVKYICSGVKKGCGAKPERVADNFCKHAGDHERIQLSFNNKLCTECNDCPSCPGGKATCEEA